MWTCAVPVITLELTNSAVSVWTGRGLIRAISTVPLSITFPPDRNAPTKREQCFVEEASLQIKQTKKNILSRHKTQSCLSLFLETGKTP